MYNEFIAETSDRLDIALCSRFPDITRSRAQTLIRANAVSVNGENVKPNYKLKPGDAISVSAPKTEETPLTAQDIPLNIVYEDACMAVINKEAGMVVHPGAGNYENTLVNALLFRFGALPVLGGDDRPGIVHRLDKDTSGLMMIAKTDEAHKNLSAQLKEKTAKRVYIAVVSGHFNMSVGRLAANIGRHPKDRKKMAVLPEGREAVTHFKVLEEFKKSSLLECSLETGRTHQIRVHMAYAGHPVLGDMVYGNINRQDGIPRQALHAKKLIFCHPLNGEQLEFEAPPPEDIQLLINRLREN